MKHLIITTIILLSIFSSCKEKVDDPPLDNDQELVTTVEMIFTDTLSLQTDTFRFKDIDGPGGAAPQIDTIRLNAMSDYKTLIRFLDESDPLNIDDITVEVLDEGADHYLCIQGLGNLNISLSFNESENNGYPIPINSFWETASVATGNVQVKLLHKEGHSHNDCNEGETDVSVDFRVEVL